MGLLRLLLLGGVGSYLDTEDLKSRVHQIANTQRNKDRRQDKAIAVASDENIRQTKTIALLIQLLVDKGILADTDVQALINASEEAVDEQRKKAKKIPKLKKKSIVTLSRKTK